jgi:hypothetical protein
LRHALPHYRHRAGVDTLCFTVPDTRSSTPPACLNRYARVYYKDGSQVIQGVRWRAHTTRYGYLYIRIDAAHPAVPMDGKTLSSRIATILALMGLPWQTWSAARVKRVDVAYDSCTESVPNALTPDQRKRKMKMWEYRGKNSRTLYIGNKSRVTAYYPKHTELSDRLNISLPCPSFRREERYMKSAVKKAALHKLGRVLAHAKKEANRQRRANNNVQHPLIPWYYLLPAQTATHLVSTFPVPCPYRGRAPPALVRPHQPIALLSSTVDMIPCCCPVKRRRDE